VHRRPATATPRATAGPKAAGWYSSPAPIGGTDVAGSEALSLPHAATATEHAASETGPSRLRNPRRRRPSTLGKGPVRRWLALSAIALLCLAGSASGRSSHYVLYVTLQATTGSASVSGGPTGEDCYIKGQPASSQCVSCPPDCTVAVAQGARITLTVSLGADTIFDGWAGDCSGTALTCPVTIDGPRSIYVYFHDKSAPPPAGAPIPPVPPPPPTVKLAVQKGGNGSGYVGGNGGVDCGPVCDVTPILGSDVQILAVPDKGSVFNGWKGDCTGLTNPCNLVLGADRTVTAFFAKIDKLPPTVWALASSGRRGQVANLRYEVQDDTGRAKVSVTVTNGGRAVTTLKGGLAWVVAGKVYTLPWKVPGTLQPGSLRFCVQARDPSQHTSKPSCGLLRIT
jgi:List-Bact-rpt repeat protein